MGPDDRGRATRRGTPILLDASKWDESKGGGEKSPRSAAGLSNDSACAAAAAAAASAAALSFWRGPEPLGRPRLRRAPVESMEVEASAVVVVAAAGVGADAAARLGGSLN